MCLAADLKERDGSINKLKEDDGRTNGVLTGGINKRMDGW